MPGPADHPLTTGLLAAVSRSFYLSLRILPGPVRAPLSLAYLMARAADTIADVTTRPAPERQALLSSFAAAVNGGDPTACCAATAEFAASVPHAGEKALLLRLPECFHALRQSSPEVLALTREVLARIIHGQSLDLNRFAGPVELAALPDAAALDEYTFLVAGCVGEFWTKICALQLPGFNRGPLPEMIQCGIDFGKGLQMVNILRDQPKDMTDGRCYLPADELRAAGLTDLTWPCSNWTPWHAVRHAWLETARGRLQSGRTYVRGLRHIRLRFASLLPLLIGEATLNLLTAQPQDQPPQPAKITRSQVKRLMLRAVWQAVTGRI